MTPLNASSCMFFPVDRSVINNREHANLDFSFIEGNTWRVGEMCVVTLELPDYPIASIRIGQYNLARSGHDWLEEFHFTKPKLTYLEIASTLGSALCVHMAFSRCFYRMLTAVPDCRTACMRKSGEHGGVLPALA